MLTDVDFDDLADRVCASPFPNYYGSQMLECMHKMNGKEPKAVNNNECSPYTFLRNLKEEGHRQCFLVTVLDFKAYKSPANGYIPNDPFKVCYRSLMLFYMNKGFIQKTDTIIQVWTKVSASKKAWSAYANPTDAKKSICQFAAMIRMAFGAEGFHYICSLSPDKDLHSFSTGSRDADVDAAAFLLVTQSFSHKTQMSNDCCMGYHQTEFLYKDNNSCMSMLNSIADKDMRNAAEMSMKL